MSKGRIIFLIGEELILGTVVVLAALNLGGVLDLWISSKASLIMAGCITGMVLPPFLPLVERILKIHFSLVVDVLIFVDLMLSCVLGEACNFYYSVPNWDKFLHFMGTAQLAIAGFAVFKLFLRKTNQGKYQDLFALIFGFFFAIGAEAIWEIYEFVMDVYTGSNMQKYVPESFLEYIDEAGRWIGDPQVLVEFYSTREGLQYGVNDTMGDIIVDCLGALAGIGIFSALSRYSPAFADSLVMTRSEYLALREQPSEEEQKRTT